MLNRARTPEGMTVGNMTVNSLETHLRYWESTGRLPPTNRGPFWRNIESELNRLADSY